jgi:hypothetical protein
MSDETMSDADKLELIARWVEHPGLWSAIDGRREAFRKILAGDRVEPVT